MVNSKDLFSNFLLAKYVRQIAARGQPISICY